MENTVKKPKKLDRRQIRTKRRIREALMALVMEKPVEKITIKELAERADIDRKTFYLHYGSIGEVLAEMQQELLGKLETVISGYDLFQPDFDALALFREINAIILESSDFYRRMLVMDRYRFFYDKLKQSMKNSLLTTYAATLGATAVSRVKLDLYLEYVTTGIMALYVHWLQHQEFDLDEVAQAASEISYGGARMVLESIARSGQAPAPAPEE